MGLWWEAVWGLLSQWEGLQWTVVFWTLVLIFEHSVVHLSPHKDGSDRVELQGHRSPLCVANTLKQGVSQGSMHRITWKAWQHPDGWAPPSEIQIQWVWSGARELTFLKTPRWCPGCWSMGHTWKEQCPQRGAKCSSSHSSPPHVARIDSIRIRTQSDRHLSFWA